MKALSTASSGMIAQQRNVEVTANNLANMNTTGYKLRRAEFHNLLYQNIKRAANAGSSAGGIVPPGVASGHGVKLASVYRIHEQGNLAATDNKLDLAIQGEGLFEVVLPDGEPAYTRDGSFQLGADGEIVTHDGLRLAPGISIPNGALDITINANGEVMAKMPGDVDLQNVGQIKLALFPNPAGLSAHGRNLLTATPDAGEPAEVAAGTGGAGTILQGYLESSNVNAILEISNLIKAQRAYEMNARVVQTADDMMGPVR